MHELGLAAQVMEVVERNLPADRKVRVRKIHLRVGGLTAVVPSIMRTCMEAVTRNTVAEGAELVLTEVPAEIECRACKTVSRVDDPPFICPACGAFRVEVISGRDNRVESIEIEEG
jgi:hydrogenase nickel incorporation protein HypA/HybF